ncbi:glycerate kinase [Cellulomonas aerilata]|uniref:glycerate kinase n=1 Tax=Cellulomonas aerilata TaxID=515326 RepID=UPI001FE8B465|nr:glycerate kinase [Cellulomonas aerilata]
MRVLVAPDVVGASLPAPVAAAAIRDGWTRTAPSDDVRVCPLSDGGSGFVAAVHASTGGELLSCTVRSPWGTGVPAAVLLTETGGRRTAYVEAAHATGPALVGRAGSPGTATSAGVGDLLAVARDAGATRVVVGVGPAVAYDAGAGMLAALGVGAGPDGVLGSGAGRLGDVVEGDLVGLRELRAVWAGVDLVAACASDLPLLGLHGASASAAAHGDVPADRAQAMERSVAHLAHLAGAALGADPVRRDLLAPRSATTGRTAALPGAGAGGGLGFGLALLGARLLPGAAVVADVVDLAARVADVDLAVTATGDLDPTVLHGSVVTTVADAAMHAAVPTVVIAGQVLVGRRELAAAGVTAAYPVREPGDDAAWSADPGGALARRAERVARTWSA